ncbi:MAG: glycosyltransferase family A protein [Actinomycetes bacterium]
MQGGKTSMLKRPEGGIPSIDLVVSTLGRTEQLGRLLESLARQSFKRFQLILVDQNTDDRIAEIVAPYRESISILHIRSDTRGVSRGRNVGLEHSHAEVVSFPDDDCWYSEHFLRDLAATFKAILDRDGMTCVTLSEAGSPSGLLWARTAGRVTRRNVFRRSIGPATFYRRHVVEQVKEFDETLGVGSGTPWGSGDDTDFLLRALGHGFNVVFEPRLTVFHPGPTPRFRDSRRMASAYSYGIGHGELLRRYHYPFSYQAWRVFEGFAVAMSFLLTGRLGRARFYAAMARGRARTLIEHGA